MEKKRVLVIDDDPDELAALDLMLRTSDYKTMIASTGKAALQMANMYRPDLLVLDLRMPVVDGFDVLSQLRKSLPALPVIVVTADEGEQTRERAVGLGASAYLVKPFDAEVLVEEIRRLLQEPESSTE